MLERGPPVWSSVYGTSSSLQHAAQLQLLSQHQMLRQQELLMIQQHAAQVLELQRNAQLVVSVQKKEKKTQQRREFQNSALLTPSAAAEAHVRHRFKALSSHVLQERLKASEHRSEMEDKADKRNTEPKPRPSSISSPSPSPVLHPRKPPPHSRSPTPSTSSRTLLPPLPSAVTTLKSEEGGQRVLVPSPVPLPHPPSPRSASPPPLSPRQPKQETAEEEEEMGRREQRERRKLGSTPFQGIFSGGSSIRK